MHAEGHGPERWTPPTDQPLSEVERRVIEATLRRTGGNITETALILGIDRSTLYDKLKRYAIERPEHEPSGAGRSG